MSVSEKEFRKIMGCFATGVAIVTTQHQGKPVGVTINTLTSVSLDPPLVLFCLGRKSATFPAFFESTHFAIHILATDQENVSRTFSRPLDRPWEKVDYEMSPAGCPLLPRSLGILQCRREQTYEGGDHMIFIGRVEDIYGDSQAKKRNPLVYYQGAYVL